MREFFGLVAAEELSSAVKEYQQREFEGWLMSHQCEISSLGDHVIKHIKEGRLDSYPILAEDKDMWRSLLNALGYDFTFQTNSKDPDRYLRVTVRWKSNFVFDMTLPSDYNIGRARGNIVSRVYNRDLEKDKELSSEPELNGCLLIKPKDTDDVVIKEVSPHTGTQEPKRAKKWAEDTSVNLTKSATIKSTESLAVCDRSSIKFDGSAMETHAAKKATSKVDITSGADAASSVVSGTSSKSDCNALRFQYLIGDTFLLEDIAIGGYFWFDNDLSRTLEAVNADVFIRISNDHLGNALQLSNNSPFGVNVYSFPLDSKVKLCKIIGD